MDPQMQAKFDALKQRLAEKKRPADELAAYQLHFLGNPLPVPAEIQSAKPTLTLSDGAAKLVSEAVKDAAQDRWQILPGEYRLEASRIDADEANARAVCASDAMPPSIAALAARAKIAAALTAAFWEGFLDDRGHLPRLPQVGPADGTVKLHDASMTVYAEDVAAGRIGGFVLLACEIGRKAALGVVYPHRPRGIVDLPSPTVACVRTPHGIELVLTVTIQYLMD